MTQTTPAWDLYRSFLGVLRGGSLSAAARELELTQPTVGRHITALEQAFGQALFTRSQSGLLPTEAARALQPFAESMASTAAALERAASSQGDTLTHARGTVRITASEVIGVEVLPPILMQLRAAHPELVVELAISNQVQDLLHREADIAVRMAPPSQDALVASRLGAVELGLHAQPDYLARRGTPRSEADLPGHDLIGFDTELPYIRNRREALGGVQREWFALRSDNDLAQLAAIRAGFGIGMCQVGLARRGSTPLTRVLPKRFSFKLDIWLAMHEDLRASPRCQVTFQALAEGLRAYLKG